MGGMTAGDVASQAIVAALDTVTAADSPAALMAEVRAQLDGVNRELRLLAARRGAGTVIGSTIAGLVVHGGHFACFWAGDSRVYRQRAGELDRLTRDHSLVQAMVDAGVLAPEDAERHPHASVIQRAVGVEDALQLDCVHAAVRPGDVFLLCSDGLTRVVGDQELEAALESGPIEAVCDALLATVLERGAPDNVTVMLVQVE